MIDSLDMIPPLTVTLQDGDKKITKEEWIKKYGDAKMYDAYDTNGEPVYFWCVHYWRQSE